MAKKVKAKAVPCGTAESDLLAEVRARLAELSEVLGRLSGPPAALERQGLPAVNTAEVLELLESLAVGQTLALPNTINYQVVSPALEQDISHLVATVHALRANLQAASWLAGLSEQERAFVGSCAEYYEHVPEGYTDLLVFADWLEDQGRWWEAGRVRKMTPLDGDVIVVRGLPFDGPDGPERRSRLAADIRDYMDSRGIKGCVIATDHDDRLSYLSEADMRKLGWVRAAPE